MTEYPPKSNRRRPAWFGAGTVILGFAAIGLCGSIDSSVVDASGIRLAISESLIRGDVNGNDARLGMKAWADAVSRETHMAVHYDQRVVSTINELVRAIQGKTVDGFAASIDEFPRVAPWVDSSMIILDERYVDPGERFLLLVNQDLGVRGVADLRGRSMILSKGPTSTLAEPWLEMLLAESNMGPSAGFFSRVTSQAKLAQVVLPVYFRQADACIVTKSGFDVMCELNPQLVRKLRVVATSPKLVSSFMTFRKDCAAERKNRFAAAVLNLYKTAYGQQALTLFQCRRLVLTDISTLQPSIELMAAYRRLASRKTVAAK